MDSHLNPDNRKLSPRECSPITLVLDAPTLFHLDRHMRNMNR